MEEDKRKKVIDWVIGGLVSIVLINLGIQEIINPQEYAGVITIILALILLYFGFYTYQIKINHNEIINLKTEIGKIKEELEIQQKLLNTIKDIVILKGVRKTK